MNQAGPDLDDRLAGVLLGTALGDALGLPVEGLPARVIARRFGRVDRFALLGSTGFVSDDTEQAALVAQSLARCPEDRDACVLAFRRSLLGWFARLPWGLGRATLLACARITLGCRRSGVRSAGNGAAMRAAVVGAFFADHPSERRSFGRGLAEVTHVDSRAVEGALYVGELAALLVSGHPLDTAQERASEVVGEATLRSAIAAAGRLAAQGADTPEAAATCGNSGFVVHTVSLATFVLLRFGQEPQRALTEIIAAGGDTDSNAAILGAWLGAHHGGSGLPGDLVARIHDGPFGPSHLRALAACLARIRAGGSGPIPRYSPVAALARNLLLWPVILAHGFRRLLPF